MGIAALELDYYTKTADTKVGNGYSAETNEIRESFESHLNHANEMKCPYSFLAKNGIISYNGVNFVCDYKQNAITLGNMYEKEKILKIPLPSGGALHLNVDNIDQLSQAAGMFTPEDLNAIMRAIHEYNHCTRKRYEIEEEKSKPIEDTAKENETPDAEKEPEIKEKSLIEQIDSYKNGLYHNLLNNETVVKIKIGSQEYSIKEWDILMERIDKDLEDIQEALEEKEEKQAEEEFEDRIQKLFEERKELQSSLR